MKKTLNVGEFEAGKNWTTIELFHKRLLQSFPCIISRIEEIFGLYGLIH